MKNRGQIIPCTVRGTRFPTTERELPATSRRLAAVDRPRSRISGITRRLCEATSPQPVLTGSQLPVATPPEHDCTINGQEG